MWTKINVYQLPDGGKTTTWKQSEEVFSSETYATDDRFHDWKLNAILRFQEVKLQQLDNTSMSTIILDLWSHINNNNDHRDWVKEFVHCC